MLRCLAMGPMGTKVRVVEARAWSLALFLVFVACAEESDEGDASDGGGPTPRTNYVVKTIVPETCLPRPLVSENGSVACQVIEAKPPSVATCSCDASTGRSGDVSDGLRNAVGDELVAKGLCGGDTGVRCSSHCLCEIEQLSGAELDTCLNSLTDPGGIYGYCYVAPNEGVGNPGLIAACPTTQTQIIRFLGENVPTPGATAFIACSGAQAPTLPP
ncbi:MAG TPA: hypothetical protein VFZ53_10820 [Polyangiaceae bacterium]